MDRSSLVRAAVAALVFLTAPSVLARDTVFGPAAFALTSGKPQTFDQPFTLSDSDLCNGKATFTVIASAGADARPVSSAVVAVNGVVLLAESDFNQGVTELRRPVRLGAANTLHVVLKGGPKDAVLRIEIRRDPGVVCGPVVEFASPAEGEMVTRSRFSVRGTVSGPRDTGVSVNGIVTDIDTSHDGTPADPYVWVATLEAAAGELTLAATATDEAANQGTATRHIVIAPPAADDALRLRVWPSSGVPPLTVAFDIRTNLDAAITRYEADLDGDGIFEISSATQPTFAQPYTRAGIKMAPVRV